MDGTTIIVVVALFTLVIVATLLVFRKRGRFTINTPAGKVAIDATNEETPPPAAIRGEDLKSSQGGLLAEDKTGRGVDVKRVNVRDDIILGSEEKKTTDAP